MLRERSRMKNGVLATVIAIAATPWLVEGKNMRGAPGGGGLPGVPGGGGSCPQSVDDIAKASWGLNADVEAKLKAGLSGSATTKDICGMLEAVLPGACT